MYVCMYVCIVDGIWISLFCFICMYCVCQVALAYSALLVGRKATVFLNTARSCRAAPPPLTHLAMRYVYMYV